jgi:hypothetical protein
MSTLPISAKPSWSYDDSVSTISRGLSPGQKRKIIDDEGILFNVQLDISDLHETVKEQGDSFKDYVKRDLSNRIAGAIQSKATFTQQKIAGPMPVTRIRGKVIIMSEDEMMKFIDLIRNY